MDPPFVSTKEKATCELCSVCPFLRLRRSILVVDDSKYLVFSTSSITTLTIFSQLSCLPQNATILESAWTLSTNFKKRTLFAFLCLKAPLRRLPCFSSRSRVVSCLCALPKVAWFGNTPCAACMQTFFPFLYVFTSKVSCTFMRSFHRLTFTAARSKYFANVVVLFLRITIKAVFDIFCVDYFNL